MVLLFRFTSFTIIVILNIMLKHSAVYIDMYSATATYILCIFSNSYYCIVCLIVINADPSTLGSLLDLNTHFVFLMCVVYVIYCICNFVCV